MEGIGPATAMCGPSSLETVNKKCVLPGNRQGAMRSGVSCADRSIHTSLVGLTAPAGKW